MNLGLTQRGRKILEHFRVPRLADGDAISPELDSAVVDALVQLGVLGPQLETSPPADFAAAYEGWKAQKGMLRDRTRTVAFRNAIETVVRPGDTVIDVGTGSGILAFFSSRAGAKDVFALEATTMIRDAAQIAEQNAIRNIHFFQGDAAEFCADQQADVVIGEFAGMFLIDEWRHFAAFCNIRDRNLKSGGKLIPSGASLFLAALDSRKLYVEKGLGFSENSVYGFDFSVLTQKMLQEPWREIVHAESESVVSVAPLKSFDFARDNASAFFFDTEVDFAYRNAGSCHGFIGYFDLEMLPGTALSTSPSSCRTHWGQSYFPIPHVQLEAGEVIRLRVRTFLAPGSGLNIGLTLLSPCDGDWSGREFCYRLEC